MRPYLLLFAVGLLLRMLFWLATPDRDWAGSAAFQGDAQVFVELADERKAGEWQRVLPWRPPGMPWLVRTFWNGPSAPLWPLRLGMVVLGALLAPLLFAALRRALPERTVWIAAWLTALSSSLLVLGNGLHAEVPFLVLVLASLVAHERWRRGGRALPAVLFGLLSAAACLVRAEHLLATILILALRWRSGRALWLAAATFVLALLPWQLHALAAVRAFEQKGNRADVSVTGLPWTATAAARLHELAPYLQGPTMHFVADCARVRGRAQVDVADLDVVREAYDCWPGPLPAPLLCLYGALNFALANAPEADGGFSIARLDRPPPLHGGDARYPRGLRQQLPRGGTIALDFPPHLELIRRGYAHGLQFAFDQPGAFVALQWHKLQYFWQGAATGFGGHALPMGLTGHRRRVDLVTADHFGAALWRLLLLAAAGFGLWRLRRQPALWPWFTFAAVELLANQLFFGYARLGALCVPLLAVAWAEVIALRAWPRRAGFALVAILLVLELARTLAAPVPIIDGLPTDRGDPFDANVFEPRTVRY